MRRDNRGQSPVRRPRQDLADQTLAFRRSRTITGSAAANVRAATENRGQLQSSRLQEHSLRKHRRKLFSYLLLCVMAAGGLAYVVSGYIGNSVEVGTAATQPVQKPLETGRYEGYIFDYFSSRPLERFSFSVNEASFAHYMQTKAPEVLDARLEKGSKFGTAALILTLREPVVTWTIKNQQYFVDADGTAYTQNYFPTPTVTVIDRSGISAEAGVVASDRLLQFIARVITIVNQSAIAAPVVSVELPPGSTRQVDFKLKDHDYIIKAHLDRDPAGQAADIINAVSYFDQKGITPSYVDVRVSSKAYYRDKS